MQRAVARGQDRDGLVHHAQEVIAPDGSRFTAFSSHMAHHLLDAGECKESYHNGLDIDDPGMGIGPGKEVPIMR